MDLQNLIYTNIGAIILGVLSIVYRFVRLEVKVGTLSKDVDAIAEKIGTKRALSNKQKREEKANEKFNRSLQK